MRFRFEILRLHLVIILLFVNSTSIFMNLNFYIILLFSIFIFSCNNKGSQLGNNQKGNHLINETSPYLLEHAHNPVDWYPWKDEALKKAKESRKLMIVSIGYSSCHWCHVMERESFSDTTVSRIMNSDFISIKIDREERPDIDNVYMTACQVINQNGGCGWPLNAITLPDGQAVWVGTYLTKDEWLKLLTNIQSVYAEDPNELEKMARSINNKLDVDYSSIHLSTKQEFTASRITDLINKVKPDLDEINGGRKSNEKFPLPTLLRMMLEQKQLYKNTDALSFVETTLNKMTAGGIYDIVEGGFSRYTTDPTWRVPHFEKMLYDNAQLISVLSYAYQTTNNPLYKQTLTQTIDFIKNNFTSPDGGFYSSYDAESEGVEGKYYVWTLAEIKQVIGAGEPLNILIDLHKLSDAGNWEHGNNILFQSASVSEVAKKYNKTNAELQAILNDSYAKLLAKRSSRVKPRLDNKVLTSWNAMMIKAYADAYSATGNAEYLNLAVKGAQMITSKLMDQDHKLYRNFHNNNKTINAFLEDYVFSIDAFLRIYELTFNEVYLKQAKFWVDYVMNHFSDKDGLFFYMNSNLDPQLLTRKIELDDQVIPSSNSVMCDVLHRLGLYYYDKTYLDRSEKMLDGVISHVAINAPAYYSNWVRILGTFVKPYYEVAIVGEQSSELRNEWVRHYTPGVILLGGMNEGTLELLKEKKQEGQTFIYVCRNKICKLPVKKVPEALQLIQ